MNPLPNPTPFEILLKYLAPGERNTLVQTSTDGGYQAAEKGNHTMQTVLMHNGRDTGTSTRWISSTMASLKTMVRE